MNNYSPTFSIAIPAFKRDFLYDAIQSCLQQTYKYFEVVVIDDKSPYKLKEVVEKFTDARIRYFSNERNFGAENVVDNWNKCLEYCRGDYVICMGDDDVLLPHCLEEYSILINKYPDLAIYHAWTQVINEEGKVVEIQTMRPDYETALSLWWHRWHNRYLQYIGDFCFRIDLLNRQGGFYKLPFAWASDDISALRAAIPDGIANTQKVCFSYRKNAQTISNSANNKGKIIAIGLEKKWYTELLNEIQPVTYEDSIFYEMIKSDFEKHWNEKYAYYLSKDIKHSFKNLFYWMFHYSEYDIPSVAICSAIKYKIKQIIKWR